MPGSDNFQDFEFVNTDRTAFIKEARSNILALQGHFGDGDSVVATKESSFLDDLMKDKASLSNPILLKITNEDFLNKGYDVPVSIKDRLDKSSFYWLEMPYLLAAQRDWAYNKIRLGIELNPGMQAAERPKAFRIFPDNSFQDLFNVSSKLQIGLDASLNFVAKTGDLSVKTGGTELSGNAGAAAKGNGNLDMVFGPFNFIVKKALIKHTNTGNEAVRWDLDSTELLFENDTKIVAVIEVPKGLKTLKVKAQLVAYRNPKSGNASLANLFSQLGQKFKAWWTGGLPNYDPPKEFDLTYAI